METNMKVREKKPRGRNKSRVAKVAMFCWINEKVKKSLQEEAAARDISLTRLVDQILGNAVQYLGAKA